MKIKRLAYHYKLWGWQLEPVEFTHLNLLVGASSVGKTQIIKAILDLKQIANGEALSGVVWEIEFSINGTAYRWLGETETIGIVQGFINIFKDAEQPTKHRPKILREQLFQDAEQLIERTQTTIKFKGIELPVKLSTFQSVLSLLNEDDHIAPIHHGFNKIIYKMEQVTQLISAEQVPLFRLDLSDEKYQTLEGIRTSDLTTHLKLALVYENVPDIFAEIKERFIELFPHVEDLKFEILERGLDVVPYLCIREHGMTNWMPSSRISSGMIKSLIFIANLYLCDDGTVILMDEFENSLGVNCITILDDMMLEDRDLQFIITSHHPYIINNVPMSHWRIVTRKGDVVTVKTAHELELGRSKHEAFMQLIQLAEFTDGIINE